MRKLTVSLAVVAGLVAAPASATRDDVRFGDFELERPTVALMQDEDLSDPELDEDLDVLDEAPEEAPPEEIPEETSPSGGAEVGDTVGGAVGFERSLGFYTIADLGGFIRFGGFADGDDCGFRCQPRVTSNLQPYIGLGVGYDILEFLAVQLTYGTGFVANAAPIRGTTDSPRDYGISNANVELVGNFYFDRIGITAKAFGGLSLLLPPPLPDDVAYIFGGNVGLGFGVRYATLLPDVTIGMDTAVYGVISPVVTEFNIGSTSVGGVPLILGFGFAPVIQYVF